jgi:hypothetical protein
MGDLSEIALRFNAHGDNLVEIRAKKSLAGG